MARPWDFMSITEPPFLATVIMAWNDALHKGLHGRQTLLAVDADKPVPRCSAIASRLRLSVQYNGWNVVIFWKGEFVLVCLTMVLATYP
jgi:hypothetical protein